MRSSSWTSSAPMAENDSQPGQGRDIEEEGGARPVAGRAARANVKHQRSGPSRSAGHVRSGAKMLAKEARKILERHRARIDADVVEQIETELREIDRLRAQQP